MLTSPIPPSTPSTPSTPPTGHAVDNCTPRSASSSDERKVIHVPIVPSVGKVPPPPPGLEDGMEALLKKKLDSGVISLDEYRHLLRVQDRARVEDGDLRARSLTQTSDTRGVTPPRSITPEPYPRAATPEPVPPSNTPALSTSEWPLPSYAHGGKSSAIPVAQTSGGLRDPNPSPPTQSPSSTFTDQGEQRWRDMIGAARVAVAPCVETVPERPRRSSF